MITTILTLHVIIVITYNTTCSMSPNTSSLTLELLFLPGLHHLHTDLIMQNVHNISLIGSTANGTTLDTVIQCNSSYGIVMTNITNLTLKNMALMDCLGRYKVSVAIKNCVNVVVSYLQIHSRFYNELYLLGTNVLGKSRFSHILCNKVRFINNEIQARNVSNTLSIDHLRQVGYVNTTYIEFYMYQHSYEILIQLTHIIFQQQHSKFLYGRLQNSILSIMDCEFLSHASLLIELWGYNNNDHVAFNKCKFMKIVKSSNIIKTYNVNVIISNCIFSESSAMLELSGYLYHRITVVIKNTKFVILYIWKTLLEITHADLLLEGVVIFHNITSLDSIITFMHNSTITIHGIIELSNNSGFQLITFDHTSIQYVKTFDPASIQYIKIKEPSIIRIHHNQVCNYFMFPCEKSLYPLCIFQYYSNTTLEQSKISIRFYDNQSKGNCIVTDIMTYKNCYLPIIYCYWLSQSTFNHVIPIILYRCQ